MYIVYIRINIALNKRINFKENWLALRRLKIFGLKVRKFEEKKLHKIKLTFFYNLAEQQRNE